MKESYGVLKNRDVKKRKNQSLIVFLGIFLVLSMSSLSFSHSNPAIVGSDDTPGYSHDVDTSGNYASVADFTIIGDLNGDCVVDKIDYDILIRNWGKTCDEDLSVDYKVSVNGINVPVYRASVDDSNHAAGTDYSFVYFDITGNVDVSIEELSGKPVNSTHVLPESIGIVPTIDEGRIEFKLSKPCNISVEPDGKNIPLLLFANPVDLNKPQISNDNVIYYGPGIHYPENGMIELSSGQTLYIDAGAIVKSAIIARGNNIKILGRGILCLDPWEWGQGPANSVLGIYDSQNVLIEGIIIRGAYGWTINLINCDGVLVSNVKQVNSKHQNDDGCDIVNSRNVTIEGCFFRNNDDCIAIKGLDRNLGDIQNIAIKNSTFWCDRARILLIGHESRASFMKNIKFENCDILHYEYFPIMVQPGEEMTVENITINNIRLNNSSGSTRLMLLNPIVNEYMEIKTAGNIRNCSMKNISITSEFNNFLPEIIIEGYDTNHLVQDVDLQNISLNGTILDYENSNTVHGQYTESIVFYPDTGN